MIIIFLNIIYYFKQKILLLLSIKYVNQFEKIRNFEKNSDK